MKIFGKTDQDRKKSRSRVFVVKRAGSASYPCVKKKSQSLLHSIQRVIESGRM